MKPLFPILILLVLFAGNSSAQTQLYGIVDTADLKMTSCDFEKDANAMVLFDAAEVSTGFGSTTMTRHKRIKILNVNGKDEANITLSYYSRHGIQKISDVEAETINLDGNVINFTKVDKQQVFEQVVDKSTKQIVFTFPQVKAGSIIEYTYKLELGYEGGFPDWDFQENLPVRYSEFKAAIRYDFSYTMNLKVFQDFAKNTREPWIKRKTDSIGNKYNWALKNVPSYKEEPYSTCKSDNLEAMYFFLSAIKPTSNSGLIPLGKTWKGIVSEFIHDEDFGLQLKENLSANEIIDKAKLLITDDEKVAYVFNWVKSNFKWNNKNRPYTIDGIKKVWQTKTGNSTEINLILYNLLIQAGIKSYPLLVSTRNNGKVNTGYPLMNSFNKTDISVAVNNNTKSYILDASDKLNTFNTTPYDVLNTTGLLIDMSLYSYYFEYNYYLMTIKNTAPSKEVIYTNAEILPEGKLKGTTQINSFSYNKMNKINLFNKLEESKYIELFKSGDNGLKIVSLKRNNTDIDSLPLSEIIDFQQDVAGADEAYIYCNPNLFTAFSANPFLSEKRNANIDFGFLANYNITGSYKIPVGYKVDVLPQTISLIMPDKSISFRRIAVEQNGKILIHYTIDSKRSIFTADEYISIHDFYKKLYELLNEQIVLKKI